MLRDLSKEQYNFVVKEVQSYFLNTRNEVITENEVETILKFFNETISPIIFNKILNDVFTTIEKHCKSLEDELFKLQISSISQSLN